MYDGEEEKEEIINYDTMNHSYSREHQFPFASLSFTLVCIDSRNQIYADIHATRFSLQFQASS